MLNYSILTKPHCDNCGNVKFFPKTIITQKYLPETFTSISFTIFIFEGHT